MRHDETQIGSLFEELRTAPRYRFPSPRQKINAPNSKGVYVIYGPSGKVLHVGSTPRARGGIAQRLRNHLAGQSSFVATHMKGDRARLRVRHSFAYLCVADARQRALLEALAIGTLCPAHIGLGLV